MVKSLGRAKARLHFSLFTFHFSLFTYSRVWRNWQLGERARPVGDEASSTRRSNNEYRERRASETTMLQAVSRKTKNQQTKFNSRVWRNWQLGERARPGGDEASSTRRSNNEYRERRASETTMLQAVSRKTKNQQTKFNSRVWRNWQTRKI